jgi:Leucine Rich repeat
MRLADPVFVLPLILPALIGCGDWPPVVDSKQDIANLSPSEPSIRARGLTDDDIPSIGRLRELKILDFAGGRAVKDCELTDAGLAELAKLDLSHLETLKLGWCDKITDAGLDEVARLKRLTHLLLPACPNITDAGLPKLNESKSLKYLDLRGCPEITADGIQQLAAKQDWQEIHLGGCPKITAQGVARLQAALPNARVEKDDQEWQWMIDDD